MRFHDINVFMYILVLFLLVAEACANAGLLYDKIEHQAGPERKSIKNLSYKTLL